MAREGCITFENMAMRVRREIIRTVAPDEQGMFIVDVSDTLADYIISRNNQNQAVLPHFENAHFFIRSTKTHIRADHYQPCDRQKRAFRYAGFC